MRQLAQNQLVGIPRIRLNGAVSLEVLRHAGMPAAEAVISLRALAGGIRKGFGPLADLQPLVARRAPVAAGARFKDVDAVLLVLVVGVLVELADPQMLLADERGVRRSVRDAGKRIARPPG